MRIADTRAKILSLKARPVLALVLCLAPLFSSGCGSVQEHRARQHRSAFQAFPSALQNRVLEAGIEEGWSPVAVYISLGTPETAERLDARTVEWTYWGYRYGSDPHPAPTDRPVFHTRSEVARPPTDQPLEKMTIRFIDDAVTEWAFNPLERRDMGRQRQTPFGRMPDL